MDVTRRKVILTSLFGAGGLGLRALATGIPTTVLASLTAEKIARAEDPPSCANPQYIFLSTSGSGDPQNANVPGCFDSPDVYHAQNDARVVATDMQMGSRTVKGAAMWAALDPAILSRTSFVHTATYTNSHGDIAKVNRLQGAVARQEMTVSLFAKSLGPCLGTVQQQPIVLANNLITFKGAVQPVLSPQNLAAVLAAPNSPLLNLQQIRDAHLNQLNDLIKQTGTKAQRAILDSYALSQTQARTLSQDLLADLAKINGNDGLGGRGNQNTAAAVLFKMNVSPVAVGSYSFGGDNHGDQNLRGEVDATEMSIRAIADFQAKIAKYGIQDRVTMAFQNVFGRTLHVNAHDGNIDGRNHNSNHHCTIFIGKNVKPSVIGGIKLTSNGYDFQATGINSTTGASDDGGDIPYNNTFTSVGKTFAKLVGVPDAAVNDAATGITGDGKVITAMLA